MIASMDGNFSACPKSRKYTPTLKSWTFPEPMWISLETLVGELKDLDQRWKELVAGHPDE
jgi:hypothetical protein